MPSGNSERYLYERLPEKRFQQLVSAVLAQYHRDVVCFPVGQKDGGRDAMLKHDAKPVLIYQVKWAKDPAKDPVAWLTATINAERSNIKRLIAEGAESYVLVTCIAGTSASGRGSMDRLDRKLAEYSKEFGIPMTCWWRADLDARLDGAPRDLLWAYSEMLAGQDAVRYLIEADKDATDERALRALLLQVIATQWDEDAKVKFRQVELDTYNLLDLFVDVEATRITPPRVPAVWPKARVPDDGLSGAVTSPRRAAPRPAPAWPSSVEVLDHAQKSAELERERLGGAAAYLLDATQPLTLVRGEPGQGKSTLAQYLCQVHRAAFLPDGRYLAGPQPDTTVQTPRVPLRVDLRDYARWRFGEDPFAEDDTTPARRARPRPRPSLEKFLAHLLTAHGSGAEVPITQVDDVLQRFPMLVVLDGLDEIAHQDTRAQVVTEINAFAARLGAGAAAPQMIVTTRPNASDLAEPSADKFETIILQPLNPELRTEYLRKWADARGLRGPARSAVEGTFRQRSIEPHIAQMADNPMQLTILLFLIQKRGDSIPDGRTQLFEAYMGTFLDRESEKSPSVHTHRADLEEVTAFLGWHLQARAETDPGAGRVPTRAIKKAILNYLDDVDKDTTLVEDLFTAVTDRVWALSSKLQGTFEFDIQSMREFFAAAYLWKFAGAEQRNFDKSIILGELARRAYWLNTSRFFAGFADPNELSGLVDVLEDEFERHTRPMQVRNTAWALLADGVFAGQQRAHKRAARLFTDDLSVRLILHSLTTRERAAQDPAQTRPVRPLAWDRGAQHLASMLLERIDKSPGEAVNAERLALVRLFDGVPRGWWAPRMATAAGTEHETDWLRLGTSLFNAGLGLEPADCDRLSISSGEAAEGALGAGIFAAHGSALEQKLIHAVLDGQCSEARLIAVKGTAGDLLLVLEPHRFLAKAVKPGWDSPTAQALRKGDSPHAEQARQQAQRRLRERDPRFVRIAEAARTGRGQAGTTSVWNDTAREIAALYGPCWLATEIAVIGAAITDREWITGGTITAGAKPFGPDLDYGTLLQETRFGRSDIDWWQRHADTLDDPLSYATWCLALICVGSHRVVTATLDKFDAAVRALPADRQRTLAHSSSRIGRSGLARRLPDQLLQRPEPLDTLTALLIAHHLPDTAGALGALPDWQLADMARFGQAGWPGLQALSHRMLDSPSTVILDGIRAHGVMAVSSIRGDISRQVPLAFLETIMKDAGAYPLGWLLAAEKGVSRKHHDLALAEVAKSGSWFLGIT